MAFTSLPGAARRLALALTLASIAAAPALAQSLPRIELPAAQSPIGNGELVFHGNYCGPGSRGPGLPPIDALDAACMHHDSCSPPLGTGLPSCGCNARLAREATAVARSPRTPDDERVAATFVAEGAKVLACR